MGKGGVDKRILVGLGWGLIKKLTEDPLTEANAQQVVVQDYSHAYTTLLILVRRTMIHALHPYITPITDQA